MSIRKSDDFISDLESQFEWYAVNANWEIAEWIFQPAFARLAVHGCVPSISKTHSLLRNKRR